MTAPAAKETPVPHPTVDDVEFRALYKKTKYVVETADGWSLVITRYRPVPQTFPQPLFGEPMLLVHGFCQNRHAWTSGEFVKNLLFFGIDIHVLELRGHGKSSLDLQYQRAAKFNRKAITVLLRPAATSISEFRLTLRFGWSQLLLRHAISRLVLFRAEI